MSARYEFNAWPDVTERNFLGLKCREHGGTR
jgi:hypothetical protein